MQCGDRQAGEDQNQDDDLSHKDDFVYSICLLELSQQFVAGNTLGSPFTPQELIWEQNNLFRKIYTFYSSTVVP